MFFEVFHFYKTIFLQKHMKISPVLQLEVLSFQEFTLLEHLRIDPHTLKCCTLSLCMLKMLKHMEVRSYAFDLCMNLKRHNSNMCLLYSQSRICNYFHLWYNMLYGNDNYIAIFTTKKCFYEVFHFYKTIFFTIGYENFSFAIISIFDTICLWKWQLNSNFYYKKGLYEVFNFYKTFFFLQKHMKIFHVLQL